MRARRTATFLVVWAAMVMPGRVESGNPGPHPQADAYRSEHERAEAALKAGEVDDAIKFFQKANKRMGGASAECYWGLARAHFRRGDDKRALESCEWLATNGTPALQAQALNLKGVVLTRGDEVKPERLQQAERGFRAALALEPRNNFFVFNLGTVLLKQGKTDEGTHALQQYLELAPSGPSAVRARRLIVKPHLVHYDLAPEFSFTTLGGKQYSRSDLEGKIVVLDFWATWCPPCVASVPELKDLTRKHSQDKVVLISVSVDEDEKAWSEFIARKKMDWPQFRDVEREIVELFEVNSFPTYIVIDEEGAIRKRISGMNPQQSDAARIKTELQPILQGKK